MLHKFSLTPYITAVAVFTTIMVASAAFLVLGADDASASTRAPVKLLVTAGGPTGPVNLWAPEPLPSVVAAADAVKQNAALPEAITPSTVTLGQENNHIAYDIPPGCEPTFGPGATSKICPLGDASSKRVVVVFGDSHAQMWTPALIAAGDAQGFAVVPIVKPGCLLGRLSTATPQWPCATWYRWAIQQVKALQPTATIVSFRIGDVLLRHPASAIAEVRQVLSSVPRPIYLAATPDELPKPAKCLAEPHATVSGCSAGEPRLYPAMMQDLAELARRLHDPAIPTVQWFCAERICPGVIAHTLVTHDGSHLSIEYSAELGPLLGLELQPILDARARASSPGELGDPGTLEGDMPSARHESPGALVKNQRRETVMSTSRSAVTRRTKARPLLVGTLVLAFAAVSAGAAVAAAPADPTVRVVGSVGGPGQYPASVNVRLDGRTGRLSGGWSYFDTNAEQRLAGKASCLTYHELSRSVYDAVITEIVTYRDQPSEHIVLEVIDDDSPGGTDAARMSFQSNGGVVQGSTPDCWSPVFAPVPISSNTIEVTT